MNLSRDKSPGPPASRTGRSAVPPPRDASLTLHGWPDLAIALPPGERPGLEHERLCAALAPMLEPYIGRCDETRLSLEWSGLVAPFSATSLETLAADAPRIGFVADALGQLQDERFGGMTTDPARYPRLSLDELHKLACGSGPVADLLRASFDDAECTEDRRADAAARHVIEHMNACAAEVGPAESDLLTWPWMAEVHHRVRTILGSSRRTSVELDVPADTPPMHPLSAPNHSWLSDATLDDPSKVCDTPYTRAAH